MKHKKQKINAKFKKIADYPLIATIIIYLTSVILVWPWKDIAINDDWDFALHVRYFSDGYFAKNELIDAAFVLQGIFGLIWTKIVGLNFISLRILTIIFTLIFLAGAYKLLKYYKVKNDLTLVTLLVLVFNPLIYMASLSFMTEMYFLAFMVWSMYFFIKYLDTKIFKYLLLGTALGALSILIRQYGLVLFIAYTIILIYDSVKYKRQNIKGISITILIFISLTAISLLWPKYSSDNLTTTETIQNLIVKPQDLKREITGAIWLLPYLGFFFLPVTINYLWVKKDKYLALFTALTTAMYYKDVYERDIFSLGNTFYLEALYGKTDFNHEISLFDNIPFKFVVSILISASLAVMFYVTAKWVAHHYKNKKASIEKLNLDKVTFVLIVIGMFMVALLSKDNLDRYFINSVVVLIIAVAIFLVSKVTINKFVTGLIILLMASIITLLNIDFFNTQGEKWRQAKMVQNDKNIWTNVYVDGTFARYMHTIRYDHPSEVTSSLPLGLNYKCFVQKYYEEDNNIITKFLNRTENSRTLNKYFINPEIYDNQDVPRIRDINKNMDKLMYKKEIFSPMYNLLGKKVFVGSYCYEIKEEK